VTPGQNRTVDTQIFGLDRKAALSLISTSYRGERIAQLLGCWTATASRHWCAQTPGVPIPVWALQPWL